MRNRNCGCDDCDRDVNHIRAAALWRRALSITGAPVGVILAGNRMAELLSDVTNALEDTIEQLDEANRAVVRLQNESEYDLDNVMDEAEDIVSQHALLNHYEERVDQLLADIEIWRNRNEELNIKVKALQDYTDRTTEEGKPEEAYVVPKAFNGHNLPELVEDINDRFRDLQDVVLVMNTLMAGGAIVGNSAAPSFTPEELETTQRVITKNFRNIREQMNQTNEDERDTQLGRIHPRPDFDLRGTAVPFDNDLEDERDCSGRIAEGQNFNLKKNNDQNRK